MWYMESLAGKFHRCYVFFQNFICEFKHGKKYNLTTMTGVSCDSCSISFNRDILLLWVKFYFKFFGYNCKFTFGITAVIYGQDYCSNLRLELMQ